MEMLQKLIIRFDPKTGACQVEGPIGDKILCYGMLKMAEQAIQDWKPTALTMAPAGAIPPVNGGAH